MSRNWLAVASAEHVEIGRNGGFMQVNHGKATPLRRIQPGDRIVYYSPNRTYTPSHAQRNKDRLQAFTAIGTVKNRASPTRPTWASASSRSGARWRGTRPSPCRSPSLQGQLAFTQEKNWGYRLRQGVIEISDADMTLIAEAMFTAAAEPHRLAA